MIPAGCDMKGRVKNEDGQMSVELCVVLPVVIAIAAILVNAMTFFGECAQFDRVARNSARICASSLAEGTDAFSVVGDMTAMISQKMDAGEVSCEAASSPVGDGYVTYSMRYSYEPTLFGLPLRGSVFGVSMPTMDHSIQITLDPYSPGKWLSSK